MIQTNYILTEYNESIPLYIRATTEDKNGVESIKFCEVTKSWAKKCSEQLYTVANDNKYVVEYKETDFIEDVDMYIKGSGGDFGVDYFKIPNDYAIKCGKQLYRRIEKDEINKNNETTENTGIKFERNKLRYDLIPSEALEEIAKVFTYGAKKYGDHNWKNGITFSSLYSDSLRHLLLYLIGENYDKESGINHLSHAIVNLCMIVSLNNTTFDDRKV